MGSGVDTDPINVGVMELPHASRMFAGGPGSTASPGQATVLDPLEGGVSVVL
jgi:hypothetical protein